MLNDFIEYCWGFYGPGGIHGDFFNQKLTRSELSLACQLRMQSKHWGDGDTFDREAVRDLLFQARGLPSGEMPA